MSDTLQQEVKLTNVLKFLLEEEHIYPWNYKTMCLLFSYLRWNFYDKSIDLSDKILKFQLKNENVSDAYIVLVATGTTMEIRMIINGNVSETYSLL